MCTGNFALGTTAALYNMGGLPMSEAVSNGESIILPTGKVPHGSYLVVIRSNEGEYVYKIAL